MMRRRCTMLGSTRWCVTCLLVAAGVVLTAAGAVELASHPHDIADKV